MHAGRHYPLKDVFFWTLRESIVFVALGLLPPLRWLGGVPLPHLPWPPVALVGTAVAFVTGFKGNAAYGRLWEARQIWGGIVNASRAWSNLVHGFLGPDDAEARRLLVLRHVAWLTALRHQLREPRAWESMQLPHNRAYQARTFHVPERTGKLLDELAELLPETEVRAMADRKNRAMHVLGLQGDTLRALAVEGKLTELRHIEMERLLGGLYDLQGRCERIKNFPYPRQYATMNLIFVWLFILLLPFAVFSLLVDLGDQLMWLTVPTTLVIAWLFHTMDKVSESSENPFEGGANDTPISAMSRAIEIDLRELSDARGLPLSPVPAALAAENQIVV